MIVTINTDAAYHSTHKIGGYAFWIVSDKGKICMSGVLKQQCKRSEIAEMRCILNAVFVVINQNYQGKINIIVNTDCLNAIHVFKNDCVAIHNYRLGFGKKYRKKLYSFLIPHNKKYSIEFRHVKAHTDTKDKRSFVNNWCDVSAKKQMWDKINKTIIQ